MKKIQLSLLTLFTSSSLLIAGGNIVPITPYEVDDTKVSETLFL